MTTKIRFTITISLVVALLVGILSSFVYVRVRTQMLSQASQSLEAFLKHEADHIVHPMEQTGLVIDKTHFGDFFLKIESQNEVIFDGFSQKASDIASSNYIVKKITQELNGKSLTLTGAYNLAPLYHYLDSLLQTLMLGWVLTLALIIPISYSLALALLKPFRNLAVTTAELCAESLEFRFAVPKYKDEEGLLVVSFNALLERLERSFDSIRNFSRNASHEIRTPVSVIMSQCEMALRKNRSSDEYRNALTKSFEESRRLKSIIDTLLSLAEIDRIYDENRKSTIFVLQRVNEITAALSLQRSNEKEIVIDCDENLSFSGNEVAFTSIISNLIENALKYGKDKVRITCMEQGERVIFLIEDDGPGMANANTMPTKVRLPAGETSHGLGLSIVRAFSEAYGGELILKRSSLGGLCAMTSLPLK